MVIAIFASLNVNDALKSALCCLVAVALSRTRSVCVVDADGGASKIFHVEGEAGLGDLNDELRLRDVVLEIEVEETWPTDKSFLGGGVKPRLWIVPRGSGKVDAKKLAEVIMLLNSFVDVLVDIPGSKLHEYNNLLRRADFAFWLADPCSNGVNSISSLIGHWKKEYVLLLIRESSSCEKEKQHWQLNNNVFELEFDSTFKLLLKNPEKALRKMKRVTAKRIEKLAEHFTSSSGVDYG